MRAARALLVTTCTTAVVLTGAGTATAGPADRATAELLQEIEDDSYQPPAWMLDPTPTREEWGYADAVVGIVFVVGLVVLW